MADERSVITDPQHAGRVDGGYMISDPVVGEYLRKSKGTTTKEEG